MANPELEAMRVRSANRNPGDAARMAGRESVILTREGGDRSESKFNEMLGILLKAFGNSMKRTAQVNQQRRFWLFKKDALRNVLLARKTPTMMGRMNGNSKETIRRAGYMAALFVAHEAYRKNLPALKVAAASPNGALPRRRNFTVPNPVSVLDRVVKAFDRKSNVDLAQHIIKVQKFRDEISPLIRVPSILKLMSAEGLWPRINTREVSTVSTEMKNMLTFVRLIRNLTPSDDKEIWDHLRLHLRDRASIINGKCDPVAKEIVLIEDVTALIRMYGSRTRCIVVLSGWAVALLLTAGMRPGALNSEL